MTTSQHRTSLSRPLPIRSRCALVVPVCLTILLTAGQVPTLISGDAATSAPFGSLRVLVVALTVVAVALLAVAMVAWFRQAAWLDGTVLVVRRLRGTDRADLRRASLELAGSRPAAGHPTLVAHPDTGAAVTLPLAPAGTGLLPTDDLHAVATAVGPDAHHAHVATYLRGLATDPAARTSVEAGRRRYRRLLTALATLTCVEIVLVASCLLLALTG